jgi:hypothetical protein
LITLGQNPYPSKIEIIFFLSFKFCLKKLAMSQAEVIKKLKDDGYRMPKPQGLCTDSYYSMMLKCWNEDPIKRPTFDALFHYFNDYFINTEPCYKDPGF